MEEQKETLYIPQGIKKEREYFTGYGMKEFKITMVSAIIALIIAFIIYMLTKIQIAAILSFMIIPSTTVLGVVKDESNISVVDQIRFLIEDSKSQKHYPYVAKDEWSNE